MPEKEHRAGYEGVQLAKRYLESSTLVEMHVTSYENEAQCQFTIMNGTTQTFDMLGMFIGKNSRGRDKVPICVEVKNYGRPGNQHAHYLDFVATAYSLMALEKSQRRDTKRHYMWLTSHPFSQRKWNTFGKPAIIREALAAHPDYINHQPVDEDLVQELRHRLWFMLGYPRLDELLMTRGELRKVMARLKRRD